MSQESTTASTVPGVSFEDCIPVAWESLQQLPSNGELLRQSADNEALLHSLLLMDESHPETPDGDEKEEHAALHRLEGKLDLLIQMMGELLCSRADLPADKHLSLSATQIRIAAEDVQDPELPPEQGGVSLRLFISPKFPRPLVLLAQYTGRQEGRLHFTLQPTDARVQELWEKLVFRQHRRQIALARMKK